MKFSFPIAIVAIAGISAGTGSDPGASYVIPTGGDTTCNAHNIVQACLGTEGPKRLRCSTNDWDCMCDGAQAELSCYNNCPMDNRAAGAKSVVDSYCAAASSYPKNSSTAKAVASSTTSSSSISIQTGPPSSSTTSSQMPQKSNGAESLVGNAAGLMAAVAGVVAVVL